MKCLIQCYTDIIILSSQITPLRERIRSQWQYVKSAPKSNEPQGRFNKGDWTTFKNNTSISLYLYLFNPILLSHEYNGVFGYLNIFIEIPIDSS